MSIAQSSNETSDSGSTGDAIDLVLAGATLQLTEALVASNSDVMTWADAAQSTFLSVSSRPRLVAVQPVPPDSEAMTPAKAFPSEHGTAWFGVSATDTSTTAKMWWSRPDGDVWFVNAHWYGPVRPGAEAAETRTQEWALRLSQDRDTGTPVKEVTFGDGLVLIDVDEAGELQSNAQVWTYNGSEITLLSIENSVAAGYGNVVAIGVPSRVVVAGSEGLMVTAADGTVTVGWQPSTGPETWYTLTIPPALSAQKAAIIDALIAS